MSDAVPTIVADIPRHLTAIAEWGACIVYILVVGRRYRRAVSVLVGALGLGLLLLVHGWASTLALSLWVPGMLVAAATMFALIAVAARTDLVTAGYLTARAFVLAELAASTYWQLDRFYAAEIDPRAQTLAYLAAYAVTFTVVWMLERRNFAGVGDLRVTRGELVAAVAISVGTFAISNLSFVSADTPFSSRYGPEIFYIRTLVDFAGFIGLFAQQWVRRELHARRDAEAMAALLRSQHDQYQITRRAIDDVNRKYHDMKHHIDALRAEPDPRARGRMLDELEDSIRQYGASVHSGNHVLDAVLTAKRAYALEHGVDVSYVADGSLLEFLRPLELTAIVGNALDNAVEATVKLVDPDDRVVRLALFAQDDFVMLRVENTFDGVIRREGQLVATRKTEEGHGYGLRNIETAVHAYGGTVSIVADDTWFSLRILFPRAAE